MNFKYNASRYELKVITIDESEHKDIARIVRQFNRTLQSLYRKRFSDKHFVELFEFITDHPLY